MKKPTLSVILASYNYSKYIKSAICAIVQQSYEPLELIIIEDASTDNSLDILLEETKGLSYVKIMVHAKNQGILYVMNEGFSLAKGDFVYYAAADDIICPGLFEKSMNLLQKHPTTGVFCSNMGAFFQNNPSIFQEYPIKTPSKEFPKKEYFFSPNEVEILFQKTKLAIHGQCCIYNRPLIIQHGGFSSNLLALTDWYLAHKIALHQGMAYIPELLVLSRMNSQTYSAKAFRISKRHALNKKILQAIESESPVFQRKVKKSCLLIQLGIPMLISLLISPRYWNFLPSLLKKKCKNIHHKITHIFSHRHTLQNR
ncbi:MAG: glycosyltransferase family A protein [Chlamydiota bacterium]